MISIRQPQLGPPSKGASERGSTAVESAIIALPLFLIIAGLVIGGYLLMFTAANIQTAATLLVNTVALPADEAKLITSGDQLVVANSNSRAHELKAKLEAGTYYAWKDTWLRHIANVTGGLVRKGGSSQLFMHAVGEEPEGLTVHLAMDRPVDSAGDTLPMVRTQITRYSLLSRFSPTTSVLVPYVATP